MNGLIAQKRSLETGLEMVETALSKEVGDSPVERINYLKSKRTEAIANQKKLENQLSKVQEEHTRYAEVVKQNHELLQKEKEQLGVTNDALRKEIQEKTEAAKVDLIKQYDEIYRQSADTFNDSKMRQGKKDSFKLIKYNYADGIRTQDIDNDRFWTVPEGAREDAVLNASTAIIQGKKGAIEAELAKTVANTLRKDVTLAATRGELPQVKNLRQSTSGGGENERLVAAIESATGKNKFDQLNYWAWDQESIEPLLNNESVIAEAKVRDYILHEKTKEIQAIAREDYLDILKSSASPAEKAQQMKELHKEISGELSFLKDKLTGDSDGFFDYLKKFDQNTRTTFKTSRTDSKDTGKKQADLLLNKLLTP